MKKIIGAIALSIFLAACGSRQLYPEGAAITASDEAILESVQRAFWEFDGIDESDLLVVVDHGDVTVSGIVSNSQEKSRILDVLRATEGINQINIEGLRRG